MGPDDKRNGVGFPQVRESRRNQQPKKMRKSTFFRRCSCVLSVSGADQCFGGRLFYWNDQRFVQKHGRVVACVQAVRPSPLGEETPMDFTTWAQLGIPGAALCVLAWLIKRGFRFSLKIDVPPKR
jgi:hypothetical protein